MKSILVLAVCATAAAMAGVPRAIPGKTGRVAFPPEAVTLLPGPLLDAQERNRVYLYSLDPERLLHNFRVNAGLPSSAQPLGGWEKPDCELRGHFVGHYLTACALMFQATGDTLLRAHAMTVVRGLDQCQRTQGTSGYVSAFPEELLDRVESGKRVWAPWYTLHKVYQGLLDMAVRCGDTTALSVLNRALVWVKRRTDRLDDRRMQAMLHVEFGGMGELLVHAYRATGNPDLLALARRFDKRSFTGPLAEHRDQLKGLHANTHIPQAIAAARLYEATGEQRYRDIAEFFWNQVVSQRAYVTGGTSNYEHWRTEPGTLAGELSDESHENCCTYNLLRLTRLLQEWTFDPSRGDYYELALYSGILPTQHTSDGGGLMYYVPMRSGLFKMFSVPDSSFWCCDGSGIESFSTLNTGAFYRDSAGVMVDLFLPSRLTWKERGVTIVTDTRYPEEETVRFTVRTRQAARFSLRIRVPVWAAGQPTWTLNGKLLRVDGKPGSYARVDRRWRDGDSLAVRFPMSIRLFALPGDPSMVSVVYGPVVLAGALGTDGMTDGMRVGLGFPEVDRMFGEGAAAESPVLVPPSANPRGWIVPVSGRPLVFETRGAGKPRDLLLVPFSRLFGERYAIYFRVWTPEQWVMISAARARYPARIVDSVQVGDGVAEDEHNFQAWRFTRGQSAGMAWVNSPLWLRYDLNIPPRTTCLVRLTISGADSTSFDVLLDGVHLSSFSLRSDTTAGVRCVTIPLDQTMVSGKQRVAVLLRGKAGLPTPRLFGCSVVRAD